MKTIKLDYCACRNVTQPKLSHIMVLMAHDSGFRAVVLYRIAYAARKKGWRVFAGLLERLNFLLNHCSISSAAEIGPGFVIVHAGGIVIGSRTHLGTNCEIRQNTTFGGNAGKKRLDDHSWSQPRVGDNVRFGCHCVILGPVIIASNSFIGACSLVIKDVKASGVYAGIPVRQIK